MRTDLLHVLLRVSLRVCARVAPLAVVASLGSFAACEPDPGASPPPGAERGLAVLHSDYVSVSLSLVDPQDGTVLAANVLHSGARAPQLSTAFSGDVVQPSTVDPRGWVTLVDRYPNAVVTTYDPVAGVVVGQLSVATGFAANPYDVAFVGPDAPGRAFVTRFGHNPTPTAAAEDLDDGDDLLVVDVATGEDGAGRIVGRIPLAPHVPADVLPRPTQVAVAGGRVWVTLAALAEDFSHGAAGVVVGVGVGAGGLANEPGVDRVVPIAEGANCADLAVAPDGAALWVVCSGVFQEGAARQIARSGVARVDLSADPPAVDRWFAAADFAGAALAAEVAVDARGRVYVVASGDLAEGTPDRLLALDPESGVAAVVHEAGGAFTLGGLVLDVARGRLWLGDARPDAPRLRVFDVAEASQRLAFSVDADPAVGLPPRSIGWFGADAVAPGDGDPGGAGPPAAEGPTPDEVVSVSYGPGAGFGQDGMPDVVLGPPAGGGGAAGGTDVLSLGHGGEIILAFREVVIVDGPGADFRVYENVLVPARADARDAYAEVAIVSVSADGDDWRVFPYDYVPGGAHVVDRFVGFAGVTPGGDAFDLGAVGLTEARFVRIQDAGRAGGEDEPDTRRRDADGDFLDDPGNACCAGNNEGFDLDGVVALHWR